MTALISLHDRLFALLDRLLSPWLLPTTARLVFGGVLLIYYWRSALTKIGDGIFGFLRLDSGVYIQMFPKAFEAAGYDPSAMGFGYRILALFGTYAEFILPLLILIGLLTRLASIGMIGFVIVQSATEIYGHGVDAATIGAWFDGPSDSAIVDQRSWWLFVLLFLVLKGPGPISVDHFLGIGRPKPAEP